MVVVVCSFRVVPCLRPNNSQQKLPDYEIYRDNDDDYVLYVNVCIYLILLYDKKNEPSRLSLSPLSQQCSVTNGDDGVKRGITTKSLYTYTYVYIYDDHDDLSIKCNAIVSLYLYTNGEIHFM